MSSSITVRESCGARSGSAQKRTLIVALQLNCLGGSKTDRRFGSLFDRRAQLSVAPSWGTTATTAATLWSLPDAARLAAQGPAQAQADARLAAELSYGLDALDGAATVSPYAGLTVADGGERTWRVGTSFRHDQFLRLSLEGTRSEHAGAAEPGHTLELRASLRH